MTDVVRAGYVVTGVGCMGVGASSLYFYPTEVVMWVHGLTFLLGGAVVICVGRKV